MTAPACPLCETPLRHPDDVRNNYCPVCHVFIDDVAAAVGHVQAGELTQADLERLTAGTGFSVPQIQRSLETGVDTALGQRECK